MLYPGDTDRPLGYILLRVLMFWEFRKPLRNPETSAQMQKPCKYYDTVFLPKSQYIWRISQVYESTIYRGIDRGNVWIMTRMVRVGADIEKEPKKTAPLGRKMAVNGCRTRRYRLRRSGRLLLHHLRR